MSPRAVLVLLAPLLALQGACSHTSLQYRMSAEERFAMEAVFTTMKQQVDDEEGDDLLETIDRQGRTGVKMFAASILLDKTGAGDEGVGAALATAIIALAGEGSSDDQSWLDAGVGELRRVMGDRLVAHVKKALTSLSALGAMVTKTAGSLLGRSSPGKEYLEDLAGHGLPDCGAPVEIVSYRAGLMRLKSWGVAEWSSSFKGWKAHLRRLHFARLQCTAETGLFILARYDGQDEPRVLLWRFFTPSQWEVVARKLKDIFKL